MSPRYQVQLSWVTVATYEVDGADDDAATLAAIRRARSEDGAPDEVTLEAVDVLPPAAASDGKGAGGSDG